MATTFLVANMLDGNRILPLSPARGTWSDVLNGVGKVECTVSLREPHIRALGLREAAAEGKVLLAAFDGDTGLQAGQVLEHDWDDDNGTLTLRANGVLDYFGRRALLPILAGRLPTDKTTDTRFMPQDLDPNSDYPWPTDTRMSVQGIFVSLVNQMRAETNASIPFVIPAAIPGTAEREYRGIDVATVGERVRQLTQVIDGVDVRMPIRYRSNMTGVEWVLELGTPEKPLLYSAQEQVFNVGVPDSSVSNLRVQSDASTMGSRAFSVGGAAAEKALAAVSVDSTLLDRGYPLMDIWDESRSTVKDAATLQKYTDELVRAGRKPARTWSFRHDLTQRPYLSSFSVGDFARVRVTENDYLEDGEYRMRIIARSGDETGDFVDLTFAPEVS